MNFYRRIFYLLFIFICTNLVFGITETRCVEQNRLALLHFKKALVDDFAILNSWKNTTAARDCCQWRGVGCNNATGQVIALDLSGTWSEELEQILGFTGEIDSSLLALSELTYLDLSGNSFTRIPEFIGSLKQLQHLKLSNIELTSPEFPKQLGNLSNLQTLDLATTQVDIKNTNWLSSLSSLKYLNLSYIDLSGSVNLLNTAIKLPSLVELQLVNCLLPNDTANSFLDPLTNLSDAFSVLDLNSNNLPSSTIYPWLFNFSTCLTDIYLSDNELQGIIPEDFGRITNLKTLDLNNNGLKGSIPSVFTNLSRLRELHLAGNNLDQDLPSLFDNLPVRSLQVLDLYGNQLTGSLPDFSMFPALMQLYLGVNRLNGSFPGKFEKNSNLLTLDLADNRITGSIPDLSGFGSLVELYFERNLLQGNLVERLGSLSNLESLGASSNFFQGTISNQHVANLSSLVYLDLSYNSLSLELGPDSSPPFQLDIISLSSCKLGSSFPGWLKTQKNFSVLDISDAGINDTVPDWFWTSLNTRLRYLNLSSNQIYGAFPDLISGKQPLIDLSSNNLSGNLPLFPQDTIALIVNDNMFTGPISSLCNLTALNRIDLSNNKLSGNIPNCWNSFDSLTILNLENNKFTGTIPDSIGALQFVSLMSMRGNNLTGEIPLSLRNCTGLQLLDLGDNGLSGKIPDWIGESLSTLLVLSLPSNQFHGAIPKSICMLRMIQILDLSVNNISGNIPKCLNSFWGMKTRGTPGASIEYNAVGLDRTRLTLRARYVFKALIQWKGKQSEYQKTLGLVVSLDLSSNRLTGEIPHQITSLLSLVALNLSRNNLTGQIPEDIGLLRRLDFLDLSRNHLIGGVPVSISRLSNLGMMDLSFNNLSGRIPKGTQLQSFDISSYTGNPALCGVPLPNRCPGDSDGPREGRLEDVAQEEFDEKFISKGFYVSIVVGFVFGFWGLCGSLLLNDSWRHAYFEFFKIVEDEILEIVEMSFSRVKRLHQLSCWK